MPYTNTTGLASFIIQISQSHNKGARVILNVISYSVDLRFRKTQFEKEKDQKVSSLSKGFFYL